MKRTDFSYDLPPSLIAQEPRERGRSRMMVVSPRDGAEPGIEHESFANFPERLSPGDVLVINDTRVIPARLFARPKAGMSRPIEILLTRRLEANNWEAWCKPAKRVKAADDLTFSDTLHARVLAKNEGTVTIAFDSPNDVDSEIEQTGIPPLPPYIARETPRDEDRNAYQTVYAAERGAIAAPTAGLHFTPEILERIAARGIEIVRITLHVGIGTFKPVKVDDIAQHVMDEERYEISRDAASRLNAALDDHRTIVAVGTTSVRTLESAIRAGDGRFVAGRAATSIFITPGFPFRAVDKLLTNFHLPESTLLMLVSAFAGIETIRRAYAEAVSHRYFFYSYGDCMFLNGRGSW
ncbi:MAG: S-adenosylmethionine:tRNA ribosyltransferase-isomerase [Thermoanaerobaculia bacterium]|jgi:S-adenosylmethionine:tRNA ribosyltransferase-isomerase|nr:S-adenosylmethionine:tRNA ribosyltransferase-isomerase [Thermoanaerobaculia bacterium]